MTQRLSRREFLGSAGAAAVLPRIRASAVTRSPSAASDQPAQASSKTRIVDMHVHFDDKRANFIPDLLQLSDRLNLTACSRTRSILSVMLPLLCAEVLSSCVIVRSSSHQGATLRTTGIVIDFPGLVDWMTLISPT